MVDTTTLNYGLTKPEDGASDDTWGVKLNANLDVIDAQLKVNADAIAALNATAGDAALLMAAIQTVDGPGSGLNADLLDGYQASDFLLAADGGGSATLAELLAVDGTGSGLDADLLDGVQGSDYAKVAQLLGYQPLDATLTAIAALAGSANHLPYFTGADTLALAPFTAYGRSLVAAADAAAARTALGVTDDGELSGNSGAGYITIGSFKLGWRTGVNIPANSTGTAVASPFSATSFLHGWANGGSSDTDASHNGPYVSATSLTTATVINGLDTAVTATIFFLGS